MARIVVLQLVLFGLTGSAGADSAPPRLEKRATSLPRIYHVRSWRDRVVLREFGVRAVKVRRVRLQGGGAVNGFAVAWVQPRSPAAKRGLQAGDIVIALRGAPVRSGDHLRLVLGKTHLWIDASITVVRRGKIRALAPAKRVSKPS